MDFRYTFSLCKIMERARVFFIKNGNKTKYASLFFLFRFPFVFLVRGLDYTIIYFYFIDVKILDIDLGQVISLWILPAVFLYWHGIVTGSFYSCGWWNLAIFWLCCCKHGWIKTSSTACNCLSPLAADHSFSLYISTGTFWPWVSCELLFIYSFYKIKYWSFDMVLLLQHLQPLFFQIISGY